MVYLSNTQPRMPVISEELDDEHFRKDAQGYHIKLENERTIFQEQTDHAYAFPASTIEDFPITAPPGFTVDAQNRLVLPQRGVWQIVFAAILTPNGEFVSNTGDPNYDAANVFTTVEDGDTTLLNHQEWLFRGGQPEGPWSQSSIYINTINHFRATQANANYRLRIRLNAADFMPLVSSPITTNLQITYFGEHVNGPYGTAVARQPVKGG